MFDHISVRAGTQALQIIRDEGFDPARVKVLAGASGAAKFLVLTGLDRMLLSWFQDRRDPLYLIGTSIGAFRMAAFSQRDPLQALAILEQEYIAQHYDRRPTPAEITGESWRILNAYIPDDEIGPLLDHPWMRICFLSNRCKGVLKSDNRWAQLGGLALAAGANRLSRNLLGLFFKRALFWTGTQPPPFAGMNQFPLETHHLTRANFKSALLSSGSIPFAMRGVSDIDGVPGMFRDGGIVDYHLDIPFLPHGEGFVFYPHFYDHITPGWFDKKLDRRPDPGHMQNVVLVAPSQAFVKALPHGKIPDREDFRTFFHRDPERIDYWQAVVRKNRILADEFSEAVDSGRVRDIVKPL